MIANIWDDYVGLPEVQFVIGHWPVLMLVAVLAVAAIAWCGRV